MKVTQRLLLSVGIAVGLLTLLMAWGGVSPIDVLGTLRKLPAEVYLLALGCHVFTYLMRAVRFRLLVPRTHRPGLRRALVISSAHNLASYILPAKTGEASLVVYLRMQAGVPASSGLASLLVARFLDGATLCLFLCVACLWLDRSGRYPLLVWLGPVALLLAVGALLFIVLSMRGDLLVRGVEACLRWTRLHHWRFGERMLERSNSLAVALRSAGGRRRLALPALTSLPLWISVFVFFMVLARSMGMPVDLSLAEATFGSALGMLANLLPVNGAAGMGTQELGWVTGFNRFLGLDYDATLSTGIGIHVVQLFNIVVFGLMAHAAMGVMPRLRYEEE